MVLLYINLFKKVSVKKMKELFNVVDYRLDLINADIQCLYDIENKRFLNDYEYIDLLELQAIKSELIFIRDKIKEIMNRESEERL